MKMRTMNAINIQNIMIHIIIRFYIGGPGAV